MCDVRSGVLGAWARAWLAGRVPLDDLLAAVRGDDAPHEVEDGTLLDVLVTWRASGAQPRLVLPAPGDVRGVPGPMAFRAAALEAGEAVVCGPHGLVPAVTDYAPSSAPASVVWTEFACDPAPPDPLDLREAQYDLTTAIRECASALAAADVAGGSTEALADARRAGERVNLPPGHPGVALLAQAQRLQAVLDLATADPVGGAVDATGVERRLAALRPLATAVRRARLAAYNAD